MKFNKYKENLKLVSINGIMYIQSYQTLVDKIDGDQLKQLGNWSVTTQKKIELNFEQDDWDGMNSEMILVMEEFTTINNILSGYNDDEINVLKRRIINDYNKLSGSFKERLYNLTDQYTREYGNIKDDEYVKCVKSILLYMFEQCLIGRKTDSEL